MTRSQVLLVLAIGAVVAGPRLHAEPAEPSGRPAYEAQGKRDPFVPLVRDGRLLASASLGGDFSHLTLVGILWDPRGNSIALINDTEARVGEVLGDYQVQEIRQDAVVLMREGKPVVLQMSFDAPTPAVAATDKKRRSKR